VDQRGLIRQAALDKLRSPERLDVPIRVTSPIGWLAMWTTLAVLVGVVTWSILGTVPTRVTGKGVLSPGIYYQVKADAKGTVEKVWVEEGDLLVPDQRIVDIDQPDLAGETEQVCNVAGNLDQTYRQQQRNHRSNREEEQDSILRWQGNLGDQLAEKARLQAKLNNPNFAKAAILRDLTAINRVITGLENQIAGAQRSIRDSAQRLDQSRSQWERAAGECSEHRSRIGRRKTIISNREGTVVKILVKSGASVRSEAPLAHVVEAWTDGSFLRARFFVDSTQGAEIKEQDKVEVSPAGVKKEEYGYIRGEVIHVSTVTSVEVLRQVGFIDDKASELRVEKKALISVLAKLSVADTPTGYEWSHGDGPPGELGQLQDVTVSVITDERPPYRYVIPAINKLFSG